MSLNINWTEDAGRIYLLLNGFRRGYYRSASMSGGFRAVAHQPYYDETTVEKEAEARGWLLKRAGVEV